MNLKKVFGIGKKKLINDGNFTFGRVLAVKTSYWYKVKLKHIQTLLPGSAAYPHIVKFEYNVGDKAYTDEDYINWRYEAPAVGSDIKVYFDRENPFLCAVDTGSLPLISYFSEHQK